MRPVWLVTGTLDTLTTAVTLPLSHLSCLSGPGQAQPLYRNSFSRSKQGTHDPVLDYTAQFYTIQGRQIIHSNLISKRTILSKQQLTIKCMLNKVWNNVLTHAVESVVTSVWTPVVSQWSLAELIGVQCSDPLVLLTHTSPKLRYPIFWLLLHLEPFNFIQVKLLIISVKNVTIFESEKWPVSFVFHDTVNKTSVHRLQNHYNLQPVYKFMSKLSLGLTFVIV